MKPYILFLPKWYPCRNDPLNGIFVKRHAKAIVKYIPVCVLYVIVDEHLKKSWYEKIESLEDDIPTIRYYYKKNITGFSALDKIAKLFLYAWCSFLGYKNVCKSIGGKPSVVHVHVFLRPAIVAFFIKIFQGVKFVVTEHWTGYLPVRNAYKGFLRKKITSFIAKKASVLMPVSEALRRAMEFHKIKGRYSIVPNVVDVEKFCYKTTSKPNPAKILFVGSMIDEHKNVTGMIRVMMRLYHQRTDFKFVIIGTGEDEAKIKAIIKNNQLEGYIDFIGYIPNDNLPMYYASCSFMIMFSRFEIQPTVLLEAMACGKPVIAPDVGGISEVIHPHNGLLIKPEDDADLIDKTDRMLDTYTHYNPHEIRNYIVKKFSNEEVGRTFFDIYTHLLKSEKNGF
ncbi:MAG TPA: glycosyltransferase [Cytophagaceae bacterium]|jgi:glycosyltransferase involved in cell wall biosynthesis|nr:glycosyltransferase [Cytophagaceae bacterium]